MLKTVQVAQLVPQLEQTYWLDTTFENLPVGHETMQLLFNKRYSRGQVRHFEKLEQVKQLEGHL